MSKINLLKLTKVKKQADYYEHTWPILFSLSVSGRGFSKTIVSRGKLLLFQVLLYWIKFLKVVLGLVFLLLMGYFYGKQLIVQHVLDQN